MPTGCIGGKAKVVDVKEYDSLEEFEKDSDKHFAKGHDWSGKLYGFVVEDAQRLKELPLKGKLNFLRWKYS